MSNKEKIAIVTLNWNSFNETQELIESLFNLNSVDWELIISDNASSDGSFELLKNKYPQFKYVKLEKNYGYAIGMNAGINEALSTECGYIMVVNNDITFEKNALRYLTDYMKSNSNVGIISGKIYYKDSPDIVWSAGGRINWLSASAIGIGTREKDRGQFQKSGTVPYLPGAAILIRRNVIEEVGLFPECYFLGHEELEFCLKVSKRHRVYYLSNAIFYHKVGYSGNHSPKYTYNRGRNRLLFVTRNYPKVFKVMWLVLYKFRLISYIFFNRKTQNNAKKTKLIIKQKLLADMRVIKPVTESDLITFESILSDQLNL